MTRDLLCLTLLAVLLLAPLTPLYQGHCAEMMRHEGDLILSGEEALVISDCVLEVTGGIYVRDNATLVLENVDVRFVDTDEELRHAFVASGGSTVELTNVRHRSNVVLNDAARLIATDSTLYNSWYCTIHGYNHTGGGVYTKDDSEASIINSKVGVVTARDNSKVEITGSTVARASPKGTEMTLINSTIDTHWEVIEGFNGSLSLSEENLTDMDFGSVLPVSKTVFRNADVKDLWLDFTDSDVSISGSQLKYLLINNDTSLTLTNSCLSGLYVYGTGVNVSIDSCSVEQVRSPGFRSSYALKISHSRIKDIELSFYILSLEITGCTIESLGTYDLGPQTPCVDISDSVIGCFTVGFGGTTPIQYRFNNVTIRDAVGFKYGTFGVTGGAVITGDIRFGPELNFKATTVDRYALITRLYGVVVTEEYAPKDGVMLTLLRGDQIVWSGETDEEGEATFPAKYARIFQVIMPTTPKTPTVIYVNNVTDTLWLRVGEGRSSVELEVGLATDTPVMVNLTRNYVYGLYALPVILTVIGLYLEKIFRGRLKLAE